jgi:hypothetical protein
MQRIVILLVAAAALLAAAAPAHASPYVRYGIQDDAWLEFGEGTLEGRLETLEALGADLVRVTLNWDVIEPRRGQRDWTRADALLRGLHEHGLTPVVTLYGTPRWANGGRARNWAPTRGATFAAFAAAAAKRYPFVKRWLIWNEPNQRRWLRPTTPVTYVTKLLNPAYMAIKRANRGAKVGGGVTAPRGGSGGVSPVAWIRGMARARARLDAYAHHPYPLRRGETPTTGGCGHCETITMATLDRLLRHVSNAFGRTRIWLTEYGYQTNPPDRVLGVSRALQARYLAEAAHRAYRAPRVDMLIQYLYRDEPDTARWQSGLVTVSGAAKPALRAYRLPLAQVSRRGLRTVVWGQVRTGPGRERYILQQFRNGRWRSVGGVRRTTPRGYLTRTLRAGKGSKLRLYSPTTGVASPILAVR